MCFPNPRLSTSILALLLACLASENLPGDTIVLHPVADTTLIEVAPDASLGGADFFNAGTAGNGNRNRALLQFSLTDSMPAGSIINDVTLSLDVVRQPSVDLQPAAFGVHRVFTSWGEGDKVPADPGSPGQGAPATAGEATWLFRFFDSTPWAAPGGRPGVDFAPGVSSTTFVYGTGDPVVFESTAELAADAQLWLDQPAFNHGWMLMTEDESVRKSARAFASRENAGGGPSLTVDFTPVPEPAPLAIWFLGLLMLAWVLRRKGPKTARRPFSAAR